MNETDEEAAARIVRENMDERRESQSLRRALETERAEKHDLLLKLDLLNRIQGAELAPPTWLTPKRNVKDRHAIPTLLLTDTHWDEVVRPEEIDFLNKYDRPIGAMRLKKVAEDFILTCRDRLTGYDYDGVMLMCGGDMFSGNIHEELKETNVSTLFDAVVYWTPLFEAVIKMLADEFGKVHVIGVVGNHGRLTRKPRAKLRAQDNVDWLLYKLTARYLSGDKRITFTVSDGPDAMVSVYETRYLLTHGDQFRGGTGISGALAPLMLGSARKTRRQSKAGHPYDVMVIGHWHQFLNLATKGLIVGPTLKGYDEYASLGNFDPEPAGSAMWLTLPERGADFVRAIVAQDRKAENW